MLVDKIVDELANNGITVYFLVTGGAIVPFVDAVGRSNRTEYYCFQHEQGAAMAAEGYYRASGKIGAVLVTSGPGVQNILNGVCGCWYDSIPALFISGQVNFNESLDSIKSSPRQLGFQECPVENMFKSCTKYSKKICCLDEIADVFSKALSIMTTNRRGPVLIDFPVNFQMSNIDNFTIHRDTCVLEKPLNSTLNITNTLCSALRPLIVLGNGVRDDIDNVKKWLETAGIPFVTSWGACDVIDHSHPLRIGYHGVYGDRVANLAVQNADVLLILGSRMDTRQTGGNLTTCSQTSIKIMVDIDNEEITKLTERGFRIDNPLNISIDEFISANPVSKCDCSEWLIKLHEWNQTVSTEKSRKDGDIYHILGSIKFPDECIIIPDCGGNLVWAMQSIRLTNKQRLFTNFGNSSMGYALPSSIGAAIGTDKQIPIVCICGDGGIQMNIQELLTLRSLNLPITILIINNSGYGIIRQFQDQYFKSRYTATSSFDVFGDKGVDIVKIANAYGIEAVARNTDIRITKTPFLYDIQIDNMQKIFPKLEFGNSLENMSPYLPIIPELMLTRYTEPNNIGNGWVSK